MNIDILNAYCGLGSSPWPRLAEGRFSKLSLKLFVTQRNWETACDVCCPHSSWASAHDRHLFKVSESVTYHCTMCTLYLTDTNSLVAREESVQTLFNHFTIFLWLTCMRAGMARRVVPMRFTRLCLSNFCLFLCCLSLCCCKVVYLTYLLPDLGSDVITR